MYNSLSNLPPAGYNILVYLATNPKAENLWKILKYNDYNCLSKPNLTLKEKLDLIWKTGPQENYSVFLSPLVEDAITESKTIIKIYNYYINKNELYTSAIVYAFDCLYGGNMALIDWNGVPASRGDVFIHTIMATLNGVSVGGVGNLSFASDLSRYNIAKATIGNSKTFTGVQIFMSTLMGDGGINNNCDD